MACRPKPAELRLCQRDDELFESKEYLMSELIQ